ncbi:hypothetical protein VKS41_000949 [Umbelopsis sp. WA50703]
MTMESSATIISANEDSTQSHNQLSAASHRLSQTLNGLAHVGNRNRSSSINTNAVPITVVPATQSATDSTAPTSLVIEFDGGSHVIVRPNRTIRGTVILNATERIYATRIRIKFRAEEIATVKCMEGSGDGRGERIHQLTTTFFETDFKLWGNDISAFSQTTWSEIEAGQHTYPFALKFPNVNYPPSLEDPKGFCVRYVWSAQVDGPGLQSGLRSKEYLTPLRPIIVAPPSQEWVYKATLFKERKSTAIAEVQAKLPKQTFCPDEQFTMQLNIGVLASDYKVSSVSYKLRKHHEGKMLVQKGMAFRQYVRQVVTGNVPITSEGNHYSSNLTFDIPTRLVSPSFASRHTRVHYDLQFSILYETGQFFKTSQFSEFTIPIAIANLPYDQLLRIPDLTAIKDYRNSKECPMFFDANLDEPPMNTGLPSELIGPLTAALASPPATSPPSYFSLPSLPPQFEIQKERQERTIYTTRVLKGDHSVELGEPVVLSGVMDEDW